MTVQVSCGITCLCKIYTDINYLDIAYGKNFGLSNPPLIWMLEQFCERFPLIQINSTVSTSEAYTRSATFDAGVSKPSDVSYGVDRISGRSSSHEGDVPLWRESESANRALEPIAVSLDESSPLTTIQVLQECFPRFMVVFEQGKYKRTLV